MPSEFAIQLQGVSKTFEVYRQPADRLKQMIFGGRRRYYDEYWALQSIDLEIWRGETVGIIGRNGAGKSTFLKLVCGTLQPTSGIVTVHGRIAALLELGFGFNPDFTGCENVYLSASILGLTQEQIKDRYSSIAEFAGIGDFIDQPVKIYSSGMYARLAFAVAAHVDADILIIDEILSVGDAAFTQKCMRFIHQFKKQGTILFVSHDAGSVVSLCDRAVWLDSGTIREIGPAKEICHSYMASLYQEKENSNTFRIGGSRKPVPEMIKPVMDARANLLKETDKRNDIHIFDFDPDAPWFGERGATITGVRLLGNNGESLTSMEGGEEVTLCVGCEAHVNLFQPVIGFQVKDRLGQALFSDNTFLTYYDEPIAIEGGKHFTAFFRFQLPYLPTGDYSVTVAIAEGTQSDHRQHHWIDDALFFKVLSSHVARGLIGVPMLEIGIDTINEKTETQLLNH
jgi:lipopolysaccharide transport system ATP-binding protein